MSQKQLALAMIVGTLFLIILVLNIGSCSDAEQDEPVYSEFIDEDARTLDWDQAPQFYECTDEQFSRFQREFTLCKNETNYKDSFCWSQAKMTICTLNEEGRRIMDEYIKATQPKGVYQ